MNNDRRKRIEALIAKVEEARDAVADILTEEQDYHDNMPESLQNGEKGEKAQEAIDALVEAHQALEEATDRLQGATS